MKRSADEILRQLQGDYPDELIASGHWLDEIAQRRYKECRRDGETDHDLRTRLLDIRLKEIILTQVVSVFLDSRKYANSLGTMRS
jgi:hypothetical protein